MLDLHSPRISSRNVSSCEARGSTTETSRMLMEQLNMFLWLLNHMIREGNVWMRLCNEWSSKFVLKLTAICLWYEGWITYRKALIRWGDFNTEMCYSAVVLPYKSFFIMLALPYEIRRPVVWFEWLYEVSSMWNVRSLDRIYLQKIRIIQKVSYKWMLLKQQLYNNWYYHVSLTWWKRMRVNRAVASAFLPNPQNKKTVNHKDSNRLNNCLNNLEWATHSENMKHWFEFWFCKPSYAMKWRFWKNNPCSKKVLQKNLYWDIIKQWDSLMDIYRETWMSFKSISSCCLWHRKIYNWFKREYTDQQYFKSVKTE